jgi:hypothetical protein
MTCRILDRDGHAWPVTGTRCGICRMPADPVLDGEPHPSCLPRREVSADEYAAALQVLKAGLGAVPIRPLDRWLVSDAPLPGAPSTPAVDRILTAIATAGSDEELTAVWQQHAARWTDDHTRAAKRRLTEIGQLCHELHLPSRGSARC